MSEPKRYPDDARPGDWLVPTADGCKELGEIVQVLGIRTYENMDFKHISFEVKKYTAGKPHGYTIDRGSPWFAGFAGPELVP